MDHKKVEKKKLKADLLVASENGHLAVVETLRAAGAKNSHASSSSAPLRLRTITDDPASPAAKFLPVDLLFDSASGSLFVSYSDGSSDWTSDTDSEDELAGEEGFIGLLQTSIIEEDVGISKTIKLQVMRVFPKLPFAPPGGLALDPSTRHLFVLHRACRPSEQVSKGVLEFDMNEHAADQQPVIVRRWPLEVNPGLFESYHEDAEPMDTTWGFCLVPHQSQAAADVSCGQEHPYLFVSAPFSHWSSGPARNISAFTRTGENLMVFTSDGFDDDVEFTDPTDGMVFDQHRQTILAGDQENHCFWEFSLSGQVLRSLTPTGELSPYFAHDSLRDVLIVSGEKAILIYSRKSPDPSDQINQTLPLLETVVTSHRRPFQPTGIALDQERGIAYFCGSTGFHMLEYGHRYPMIIIEAWNQTVQARSLFQTLWLYLSLPSTDSARIAKRVKPSHPRAIASRWSKRIRGRSVG